MVDNYIQYWFILCRPSTEMPRPHALPATDCDGAAQLISSGCQPKALAMPMGSHGSGAGAKSPSESPQVAARTGSAADQGQDVVYVAQSQPPDLEEA